MRVLVAHVGYRRRGGEDVVFDTEVRLLTQAGHAVSVLNPRSSDFDSLPLARRANIALSAGVHSYGRTLVAQAVEKFEPDVVHFHNLYPHFGVGALAQASEMGCAVVQTLHNYRLSCVAGTHVLKGEVCERCVPGHHSPGVVRRCYRGSMVQSAAMAASVSRQWAERARVPHMVLALTAFAADRLIGAGMPAERVVVKPNSVDEGHGGDFESRGGVCCVARLSPEKGVSDLAAAWPSGGPRLRIAGDGPERARVCDLASKNPSVDYIGPLKASQARELIRDSRVVVVPSKGFEGMPLTVLEGFAESTPALMLAVGARAAMGGALLGESRDVAELARAAVSLHESREEWTQRSAAAHGLFLERHTHELNVRALESVYRRALEQRGPTTQARR